MSDQVQVVGHGLYGHPRRFCYIVHDQLTAQTCYASKHACIAYVRAMLVRRRIARGLGIDL
jgi:hypothetical protein